MLSDRRRRGDSHVGARDHHGAARIHVPLAHGRSDEGRIPLLRRPVRSPAFPIATIMPASPISRSPIASVSANSLAAEQARSHALASTACRSIAAYSPSREGLVERIARAAHGPDRIGLARQVEGLAQAADMHIHRSLVDIDVVSPHRVEQMLAAEDPAGALHQEFQQPEFGRAEMQFLAGAAQPGAFRGRVRCRPALSSVAMWAAWRAAGARGSGPAARAPRTA